MTALFLTSEELRELTGYATRARQIAQLRAMGIPFRINGCGRPVVTRMAVEGAGRHEPTTLAWHPTLLQGDRKAA